MKKQVEYILGLDISTSVIGMSLFKHENDILDVILSESLELKRKDINKLKGLEALLLKSKMFEEKLKQYNTIAQLTYNSTIDRVVIETPLVASNNVLTVGVLMRFSGIITSVVYNMLNIIPEEISSYDARCFGFPQLMEVTVYNKKGEKRDIKEIKRDLKNGKLTLFGGFPFGVDKKNVIFDLLLERYPNINILYNKVGELKRENFDSTDSMVCVFARINMDKCDEKPKLISQEMYEDRIEYKTQWNDTIYNHVITI